MEKKVLLPFLASILLVTSLNSEVKADLFPTLSDPNKELLNDSFVKHFFEKINKTYGLTGEDIYQKFRGDALIKREFIQFLSDKKYEILDPNDHQKVIQLTEFALENGYMYFKDETSPFRKADKVDFSPFPSMKLGINNKFTKKEMKNLGMYSVSIPKNISGSGLTSHYNKDLIVSLVEKNLEIGKNQKGEIVSLGNRAAIVFHNEYVHKLLLESGFDSISQCGSFVDSEGKSHQSLHLLELISQYYSYQIACDPNHLGRKNDLKRLGYSYYNKKGFPAEESHPYMKGLLYFNKVLSEETPELYSKLRNSIHNTDNEEKIPEYIDILFKGISQEKRQAIEYKLMVKIDETLDLLEQNQQYVLNQK